MRTVQLEYLRPTEILAERERCPIVYLPLGPLEWHGPAMPFGTDPFIAQALARAAAERLGGVVMPTLFVGTERERPASILRDKGFENPEELYIWGMDVPANCVKSFYAREDLFSLIVREHLRLLVQQQYRLIVIVNGHGAWGQRAQLERLSIEFSHETPAQVVVCFPDIDRPGDPPLDFGHACKAETSLIRYLHDECVALDALPPQPIKPATPTGAWPTTVSSTAGPRPTNASSRTRARPPQPLARRSLSRRLTTSAAMFRRPTPR